MDCKNAIECIKKNYPPSNYTMLRESLDLAMETLEKQISKPVKITQPTPTMIYITCLNCGTFLDDRAKDNYCFGCGQKLDWS